MEANRTDTEKEDSRQMEAVLRHEVNPFQINIESELE